MGDILHLKPEENARGCIKYENELDEPFYTKKIGQKLTTIPTAPFCPSCSSLSEYDRKYGKVQRKFILNKEDLIFNLSYKKQI